MSASSSPSSSSSAFQNCWSCRLLSGSTLLVSAGFVYHAARRTMRQGGPVSFGTVAQIVFASGVAALGLVVLIDPVKKTSEINKNT